MSKFGISQRATEDKRFATGEDVPTCETNLLVAVVSDKIELSEHILGRRTDFDGTRYSTVSVCAQARVPKS